MEYESDGDISCNWCSRYSHQRIDKGTGGFGNNFSFIKTSQNTKKSPVDLRRLAVTQTPSKPSANAAEKKRKVIVTK